MIKPAEGKEGHCHVTYVIQVDPKGARRCVVMCIEVIIGIVGVCGCCCVCGVCGCGGVVYVVIFCCY